VYRDILPETDLEAPEVYAIEAGRDGAEFTILMEDLSTRPGCRVGFVLDPTSADEVDSVLDTVARLHVHWWGRHPSWARFPVDDASMRFWREIGPRLTKRHLESGHRAGAFDEARWPQESLWQAFDQLLVSNGTGPLTFLHGDVHAGNVYYLPGRPGGLLDWQLSLSGSWALDVAYLLTSALTVDDRRAAERGLLAGYLDRLRAGGVDAPTHDEAWDRYRQNALYGVLMWLITPDGVHSDAAQREYLTRCVTAAEDLETIDALTA
jgi:aminoglycoside phosphotransferase (APT) family kinase protein